MKNSEIVAAYQNMGELIKKKEKYPVKFSYAIIQNTKKLEDLMKAFEEERNRLLDQYNVKDENGKPAYQTSGKIEIDEKYQKDWERDMEELLGIEVEFLPHQIDIADFPETMEPLILIALDFMIKE